MNRSNSSRGEQTLRWVTAAILAVAILENAFFILAFAGMAPTLGIILPAVTFSLSSMMSRWLSFRGVSATWALLCTALAVMAWPWTTVFLIGLPVAFLQGPKGINFAWLFGPLIPYTVVGLGALARRRKEGAATSSL